MSRASCGAKTGGAARHRCPCPHPRASTTAAGGAGGGSSLCGRSCGSGPGSCFGCGCGRGCDSGFCPTRATARGRLALALCRGACPGGCCCCCCGRREDNHDPDLSRAPCSSPGSARALCRRRGSRGPNCSATADGRARDCGRPSPRRWWASAACRRRPSLWLAGACSWCWAGRAAWPLDPWAR